MSKFGRSHSLTLSLYWSFLTSVGGGCPFEQQVSLFPAHSLVFLFLLSISSAGVHQSEARDRSSCDVRLFQVPFDLPLECVTMWLQIFGQMLGEPVYDHLNSSLCVTMILNKPMPQLLPIEGHKVRVRHFGMPLTCYRCLQHGHVQLYCRNEPLVWYDYLRSLQAEFHLPDWYFKEFRDSTPRSPMPKFVRTFFT